MEQKIKDLLWVEKEYDEKIQVQIDRLHRFNEAKDAAQEILGRLASMRGVAISSLYEEFGIEELIGKN